MSQKIPVSATLERKIEGICIPPSKIVGRKARVELWSSYSSLGYKSDFSSVPKRWLKITIFEPFHTQVFSYTGKNYEEAEKDFERSYKYMNQDNKEIKRGESQ